MLYITLSGVLLGLFTLSIVLLVRTVYLFIIRPYIRLQYYRKQGVYSGKFIPIIGFLNYTLAKYGRTLGDAYYGVKELKANNPGLRAIVYPFFDSAQLLLGDPELVRDFSIQQTQCYEKIPRLKEPLMRYLGKGMFLSEGDSWKRQRALVSNAFHYKFIQDCTPMIIDTTEEIIGSIQLEENKSVKALEKTLNIAGNIICRIFCGQQAKGVKLLGQDLTSLLTEIMVGLSQYGRSAACMLTGEKMLHWGVRHKDRALREKLRVFYTFAKQMMEREREAIMSNQRESREECLLGILLHQQHTDELAGEKETLTDEEILHQFITFFMVGMDTTGRLSGLSTYYIAAYPQVQEKLMEELSRVGIHSRADIKPEKIQKLEYMDAVIKEVLRFGSPTPGLFPRVATRDHYLGSYHVKKGTFVTINYFFLWYNEKYFRNATNFVPERWIGLAADSPMRDPFVFTPFHAGQRNCIGQHLAMMETKLILTLLLLRYKLEVAPGYKLRMVVKFLHEPEGDVLLHLTPRASI